MSSAAAHEPASVTTTASARVADLFERHGRMVYGICRAMMRDVQEAEDAMQQAFLSAHRALLGGARVRDPGAWIATIARNECRSRITAGMRAPSSVDDDILAEIPHGVDDVERRMQAREVRAALAQLPERQREAVVLRYLYGLGYGEVATALGLSRPATEALLFRARRAMRRRLRHAAAVVLVTPLSVREELALALPGFDAPAGESVAAAGIAGGVLAKLASAPAAAKLATATVAISTVGAVGVVESHRPAARGASESRLAAESRAPAGAPAFAVVPGRSQARRGAGREREFDAEAGGRPGAGSGTSQGGASEISFVRTEGADPGSVGPSEVGSRAGKDDEKGAGVEPVDTSGPGSGEARPENTDPADDDAAEESSSESSEQYRRSGSGSDDAEHEESDSEGMSDSSGSGSGSGAGDDGDSSDPSGSGSSDDPEVEHP